MARAWTLISIFEGRQYGGNLGYEDDLEETYRYDSSVANHRAVRPGDLVFLRDEQTVFGMARIEGIERSRDKKTRRRCPECGTTAIKARVRLTPKWRCASGHTFAGAARENVEVTAYQATYENTFIELQGTVSVRDLKRAALRPNDQLSIEEIDAGRVGAKVISAGSAAGELLAQHLQATGPDQGGYLHWKEPDTEDSYTPALGDRRKRINRSILLRRGQRKFRKKLIRRYGPACLISGCKLLDVVEAAHIWPYRGERDNHPANGLLLRADLHTLFDLDLLGINPRRWIVRLHPRARSAGYSKFEGRRLRIEAGPRPSASALRSRWNSFVLGLKS